MTLEWLQALAAIFVGLSVLTAIVILADILNGHRQPMAIMSVVWPITGLYFGPFALWAYAAMGRPKADPPGGEAPKKPFWRTVFVATCHCGAGCTLGDTVGETAIFLAGVTVFGSVLLTASLVDFVLAYTLGVVFQYFTIAPMRNLGVKDGIIAAIKADTISLVAFEVGMFGFMALNRLVFFDVPPEPNSVTYWFLMQIAMIVGFATSYPANWWLVKSGLKEAM